MKMKGNDTLLQVTPLGDIRWRVHSSVRLWIINRVLSKDKTCIEIYGVLESIERIVYQISQRSGVGSI